MGRFGDVIAIGFVVSAACGTSSPATSHRDEARTPPSPSPSPTSSRSADSMTTTPIPPHLQQFPGLSVRRGDDIVPASGADVAVAEGYARAADRGEWRDERRITILTARTEVRVGEPVRIVHVAETLRVGDELYVMGPKEVRGEHVDGQLRTAPGPTAGDPLSPGGLYDGRKAAAPAVDYNYDVTEYTFDGAGDHTIVWKLGALESNQLAIKVAP